METAMDYLFGVLIVGVAATAVTDLWMSLRWRLFGIALPDYALLGRWLAHMPRGQFRHAAIKASPPMRGERAIGWSAHYLTGITFAGLLLAVAGPAWARQPTLLPALLVGVGTVAAPFLLMQPGMGAGIAARRMPHPNAARLQSLVTHTVFGLALYAGGLLFRALIVG